MRGNSGLGPAHLNHPLSTASQVERRERVYRVPAGQPFKSKPKIAAQAAA
jgi:hypothetical protein